ncbi:tyrosine-type recombinase/integrase [Saccharomonospora azurea]|uniref:Site-specific recombinase XerD n=1 Tax=Saccharomonospora azurea NA-128 TaxID=882081 RepID=H8GAP0_9PSEU|nr:tyrosine-type recombinase/integrase [Saccharomonospora azurea]EHK87528.1 site-specific recombinase XerD [Saccharomonospora azurea SZMC 14600]EHY87606.1 site-specific recombinase XerD [Saccharomonospora azurea NA-128]
MAKPERLSDITVRDATLEYLEILERRVLRGQLATSTLTSYRRDLDEFTTLLGPETDLDSIEADDLEIAMTRLAKAPDRRYRVGLKIAEDGSTPPGRGPYSLARWFAAVRGLFRWAADKGYVQVDPTLKVTPPRTPSRAAGSRVGLRLDEALVLRGAPSARASGQLRADQRLSLRDEAILRLLVESGPRVSELCGANRSDIRLHEETRTPVLHVRGKGQKDRDLPLSQPTAELIERYLAEERPAPPSPRSARDAAERRRIDDAAGALFVSIRGWRLAPRDVQRMVQRYTKEFLGRRATPHSLRHTALTILARAGVDIATVAQIAGHASLSTTSVYMDDSMSAAAEAIEGSPLAQP